MPTIINIVDQVFDGKDQERDWTKTKGIMLHRAGVNLKAGKVLGYDGLSVARAFIGQVPEWEEVARATNRQNAYTLMIGSDCGPAEYDGQIWQCLPIDEIGWHGRQYSKGYIGMAWLADPRVKPLSRPAWNSTVDLCADLCLARGWDPYAKIKGHGEVPKAHDGSKAPGETNACPGLSKRELNVFRDDVDSIMRERGLVRLAESGFIFTS